MSVRRTINRRERGMLFVAVGLVGLALILGVTLRKPFALAEGTWQGGQYTDSRVSGRDRSGSLPTTRSGTSQVALTETAVQRPRLQPGEAATLRAVYDVPGPIQVRETRIIRYDGLILARIERVMTRTGGSILSEYRVNVPRDAADGWYSVTTSVERIDAVTRGGATEQKETGFYVDAKGTAPAAPVPGNTDDKDAISVKLSANQTRYKIGDRLILSFEANRDAFLTIVNVGTSGEVSILFPNRFSGGHAVKAGRAYRIPEAGDSYELEVKGPPGVELVYALLTLKPVLFLPTDFPSTGAVFHSTSEKVTSFTRDINVAAKSIPLREQAKAILELEVAR